MCLLDRVLEWTEQCIVCETESHHAPDHPLRAAGRLGAAVGVEYAAQAMAVHGSLMASMQDCPRQGFLTSVRDLTLNVERLDDLVGPLRIRAELISRDDRLILYQFQIHHQCICLLEGRASVVLDAQAL